MRISFSPLNLNSNFLISKRKVNNFPIINNADFITFTRDSKLLSKNEGIDYANRYLGYTSGYRGILDEDFNDRFVYTMTQASSRYMFDYKKGEKPITLVGGDTREATKRYAPKIISQFKRNGIDVLIPHFKNSRSCEISPVASPVLAVCANTFNIPLSVLLTASHNPWNYGGYNFMQSDGMVVDVAQTKEIAKNLIDVTQKGTNDFRGNKKGSVKYFDPYEVYKKYLKEKQLIDFKNIKNTDIDIFYDDLSGCGRYYLPRLLSDNGIYLKGQLSSNTSEPNPVKKHLTNLKKQLLNSSNPLRVGFATDCDSDRYAVLDEHGSFVDANDFLVLIAYHLIKNKNMTKGTIIKNQSTSQKLDDLADYFNKNGCDIDIDETPVGFKYLGSEVMRLKGSEKDTIIAGEGSSGGLTIRGHLPEKDGFVAILTLLDLIATEKKPLSKILKEVNGLLGVDYINENINVMCPNEKAKNSALESFKDYAEGLDFFFGFEIDKEKTKAHKEKMKSFNPSGDGYKIYLKNSSSIVIRKSGTEPILRFSIDSKDKEIHQKLKGILVNCASMFGGSVINS